LLLANECFGRCNHSSFTVISPLTFLFFISAALLISRVMASPVLLNYLQDGVGGWGLGGGGVISGPRSSLLHLTLIVPPWGCVFYGVHAYITYQPLYFFFSRLFQATPGISSLSDHLVFFSFVLLLLLPLFLRAL
jgi:hypothetical protein